mgnify:CR=1 FL=1
MEARAVPAVKAVKAALVVQLVPVEASVERADPVEKLLGVAPVAMQEVAMPRVVWRRMVALGASRHPQRNQQPMAAAIVA